MITCALTVRNEIHRIDAVMQHVLSLPIFTEILVVDQSSDDGTLEVLRAYEAAHSPDAPHTLRVEQHSAYGCCEMSRPWVIQNAKGPWVLLLDADEELTTWFVSRAIGIVESGKADLYTLDRITFIHGHKFAYDPGMHRLLHKDRVRSPVFNTAVESLHSGLVFRSEHRIDYPCILTVKSFDEQLADNERYYSLGYPRPEGG